MNEKLEVVATAAQIRFLLSSNYLELGSSCFPPHLLLIQPGWPFLVHHRPASFSLS